MTPAAFFIRREQPITVSAASDRYPPTTGIKVPIANFTVLLAPVIDLIKIYSGRANIDIQYLPALLKIIGIAYIVEFGAEICRDAGENAIASKIELAGKVLIAIMAIPIITSLLELVIKIMP
jgi:stage III sporulation protein AD